MVIGWFHAKPCQLSIPPDPRPTSGPLRIFVCHTPERFYAVATVLAKMVEVQLGPW